MLSKYSKALQWQYKITEATIREYMGVNQSTPKGCAKSKFPQSWTVAKLARERMSKILYIVFQ